jgi:sulfur relay (sulfurtransferase) complex TusBCD TusD component (DsrE family)
MARYCLIESRDPIEARDVSDDYALARDLAANGDDVTLFLVQNGVLPARARASAEGLDSLVASGARVAADTLSLRERGIAEDAIRAGIEPSPIDLVLDAMVAGDRVVWL